MKRTKMIRSLRGFFFFSLLLSVPLIAKGLAEEKPWTDQFLSQFEEIKARLVVVEQRQQEILAKDAEILEKLDTLRKWVRNK